MLFEKDDCSGDELEFKISHNENNCKYCLDTCNERFTTNPNKDVHKTRVQSVWIYDTEDIGFVGTTYWSCSGSFGYVDPGFQNKYITSKKCVKLPWGFAHIVFWAPAVLGDPSRYVTLQSLKDNLKVSLKLEIFKPTPFEYFFILCINFVTFEEDGRTEQLLKSKLQTLFTLSAH